MAKLLAHLESQGYTLDEITEVITVEDGWIIKTKRSVLRFFIAFSEVLG